MKTFFMLFILILLSSCGKQSGGTHPESVVDPVTEDQYLNLINNHRVNLGLRPLINSDFIKEVAHDHSEYMAGASWRFGHTGWQSRCSKIRDELRGNECGEIIARGQSTPEEVFHSWLNSPDHRKTIEDPDFTHTGLGVATNSAGEQYWTEMFLEVE